jgi:MFS family permease
LPVLPDSVAVLRRRDFRLMFAAQAVSHFGDRIVLIALAFAVLELGGSATDVGLVLASQTLGLVACLLIGGVVADRERPHQGRGATGNTIVTLARVMLPVLRAALLIPAVRRELRQAPAVVRRGLGQQARAQL